MSDYVYSLVMCFCCMFHSSLSFRAGKLYNATLDLFEAVSLTLRDITERDKLVDHFLRVQLRVEACQQKAKEIGQILW